MEEQVSSKVLIVDDVPINCMILSSLLASNGVTSDIADGGKACIELCKKNAYDLILLDHRMPEIDGVDTLLQLKEMFRKTGREIPIVCHTTEDARNNINLYKAAGFADVLIKPIEPKRLTEILLTYLPEGDSVNQEAVQKVKEKTRQELSELPDWLHQVPGLNLASGIEQCETKEDYLDAITVFASSIQDKAVEIEHFMETANWKMYTLKVHSLKSMSRLIGAEHLSDLAASLEFAGKQNDVDTIMKRTPELLKEYRSFHPYFQPETSATPIEQHSEPDSEHGGVVLPDISEATLQDAYDAIADFVTCYDTDSILMVLDSLKEYRLDVADQQKLRTIQAAVTESNWEQLRKIIDDTMH